MCETLVCGKEPSACFTYSATFCTVLAIANYCPGLCGRCPGIINKFLT